MSTPHRKCPGKSKRKKGVPVTPLTLFRDALGTRNAGVMDFMPLDKIDYVEHHDPRCDNFLGHKIRLGSIVDDKGTSQVLWAYMTKEARNNGLPEVHICGSQPSGERLSPWSMTAVMEKAELRGEFKTLVFRPALFSAVLKVKTVFQLTAHR
jgi:hypothetical protein